MAGHALNGAAGARRRGKERETGMNHDRGAARATRILFVCHGNICRSPMAEFVMKKLVGEAGLSDAFEIDSAATSWEELGCPVYPPARRELAAHGIGCAGKTARRLEPSDYARYDWLVGMEDVNLRNMRRICGGDPQDKMRLLMDFAGGGEIEDPWYSGRFGAVYRQIETGCRAMLDLLIRENRL